MDFVHIRIIWLVLITDTIKSLCKTCFARPRKAERLSNSWMKIIADKHSHFIIFFATSTGRLPQPCSPGLPPVPMNRFPFPSHSPSSDSASQWSWRRADVCGGVREKASPKNKAKLALSPARQRQSGLATGRLEVIKENDYVLYRPPLKGSGQVW